ncbi:MAG TPA: histidine kinase [Clostridiales bacterium]|nr:histidine kinase [Clostridiales bacterium]
MKQQIGVYSIKWRVLKILMGMLIPVLAFLIFLNWFVIHELDHKIVEANGNTLYIQCEGMEKTLKSIDNAMVSIIAERPSFYSLTYGKSVEYDDYVNSFEIAEDMKKMMYPYYDLTACALISLPKEVYMIKYNIYENQGGSDRKLLDGLKALVSEAGFKMENNWIPLRMEGESYLIRIMGYRETYLIGMINLGHVVLMQNNIDNNDAITVFYNDEGYYTDYEQIEAMGIELKQSDEYYFVGKYNNQYLVVESELNRSTLRVAYLTPRVALLKSLSEGHLILLFISLALLLAIPMGYHLLKKIFFRPLDCLVGTMEQIRDGDMEVIPESEYREIEFQKVGDTLYSMVREIRNLKIDSYEKQLEINHIQLQYYQEQIKPHFYLNCLKNIYGMIVERKLEDIQRLIILLSNHLRYMLQEERRMVTLEKELQYIRNFVELQQICMKYPPLCIVECEPELAQFEIPSISLLSFVENSIKYGMNMEKGLQIYVRIGRMIIEGESFVYLSVSDNGRGFGEDMLKKLNFELESLPAEGHIGIYNVIQRYRLQFGEENVIFAHSNYEGAFTEIFIKAANKGLREGMS